MASLDLHVDEQNEVLLGEPLSGLCHDLLHSLDVAHDARDHQRRQLLDSNLSCLEVSDEHSLV